MKKINNISYFVNNINKPKLHIIKMGMSIDKCKIVFSYTFCKLQYVVKKILYKYKILKY